MRPGLHNHNAWHFLELFKGEFLNHSGSKCCNEGLEGIIYSQAKEESVKKQAVLKEFKKKKSRWLKMKF